jgi:RNA polymerase sigma factor (TIGR02999 family)
LPLVYDELRKLAAQKMAQEQPGQTLEATALVHEAYLRLVKSGDPSAPHEPHWSSRGHFFAAAAEAMRRILVEQARRKLRQKHGGDRRRVDWNEALTVAQIPKDDPLASDEALTRLDDALAKLAAAEPRKAELVKLRFFAGLTIPEAARFLGISTATAERDWTYARVWLYAELSEAGDRPGSEEKNSDP